MNWITEYKKPTSVWLMILIFLFLVLSGVFLENRFKVVHQIKSSLITAEQANHTTFASPYYMAQLSLFDTYEQTDVDILFIGDSLIDNADWYLYFEQQEIVNLGIQGERAFSLGNRLHQVSKFNPEAIVILIGINDILLGRTVEEVFSDYIMLVNELTATSSHVYVISIIKPAKWIMDDTSTIHEVNTLLENYSTKLSNLSFLEINKNLSDGTHILNDYSHDGIHLNAAGYNEIVAILKSRLVNL